ncbi:hypothetical protein KP509_1Z297000 [Ceratopteris richardii]|nr:hypothetical protein KP509_1Z297000 [Ceratopteris richardii]
MFFIMCFCVFFFSCFQHVSNVLVCAPIASLEHFFEHLTLDLLYSLVSLQTSTLIEVRILLHEHKKRD